MLKLMLGSRKNRNAKPTLGITGLAALITAGLLSDVAYAQGLACDIPPSGGPKDSVICDLGTLGGRYGSRAYGINADGTVAVGASNDRAFRWVEGTGMQDLGTLSGAFGSFAHDVNADGTVVVGESGFRAFRWVEGNGMKDLGTLVRGGFSRAHAVNADGTVVVGVGRSSQGIRAFRWVEGKGMESLGTLSVGGSSYAYDVSADGSVVVGTVFTISGRTHAFIWRAGTMEDYVNLIASFEVLGNDSAVMQAEQQFALGQIMSQGAFAAAGQTVMSSHAGSQITNRNPTTVGARTTSLGALTFGKGLDGKTTVGATLSLSGSSLNNNAYDMGTGFGAAIWGQYSEGGVARTGLQVSGALGYMRNKGEVARGRLLTDVVLATGNSSVTTRAAQVSVGYGYKQGDWLLTPSLGVAHYDTTRAAYTESGGAFNASYDAMDTRRTVATAGITGEFALSENGRLLLGAGVDYEVDPERPRLTGTSDIPGLTTFDVESTSNPNRTRAFATAGYVHHLENGSTISGDVRFGKAAYGSTPSLGLGVSYSMRF